MWLVFMIGLEISCNTCDYGLGTCSYRALCTEFSRYVPDANIAMKKLIENTNISYSNDMWALFKGDNTESHDRIVSDYITDIAEQLNEQTDYSSIKFTVYSLSVCLIAKYVQYEQSNREKANAYKELFNVLYDFVSELENIEGDFIEHMNNVKNMLDKAE